MTAPMEDAVGLRCRDRMSVSIVVRIERSRTIRDLKEEISRRIGRDVDQISLKRGRKELVDAIDIDTYELMDGECIGIEYK